MLDQIGNDALTTVAALLGTGAAARVAYGAWRASKQSNDLPPLPSGMEDSGVEFIGEVKEHAEPVVTSNRLSDQEYAEKFQRKSEVLASKSEYLAEESLRYANRASELKEKTDWLNQYNLTLGRLAQSGHSGPSYPHSVETETKMRLLPPLANKPPFQQIDGWGTKSYVYNVVIDGKNQLLMLPESAHRRLVNVIASELDREPTDPYSGLDIRVKKTSVGNVPHYDFVFEGPNKIHEDPTQAACLVNNQVPLPSCVSELVRMIQPRPSEAVNLGKMKGRQELKQDCPVGTYVQITNRVNQWNQDEIGYFDVPDEVAQSHEFGWGRHRTVIDGDYGKVVGYAYPKNSGQRALVVEITDHTADSIAEEISGNYKQQKIYGLMRTEAVKKIPTPLFNVGDMSNWLTKSNRTSPSPSRVLAVQWNGNAWVYTLHWFQGGQKEIRFSVEQHKMLGLREGDEGEGAEDYQRQAQEYLTATTGWKRDKDAEENKARKQPYPGDLYAQLKEAGHTNSASDLYRTLYNGK